ncbi:acyltransferase-like protein At1g54570, chloroplastic [Papaver somniferum]|uniref:acyltransferase-like protein At1g54570, chloroplastic n=1 Tax=Papaver somniferum TaxID=3469 RepID=UPI000E6FB01C|nr:acyltransferase-like protein At1g54570, chloroplastic [Papaver somniferum]
MVSTLQLFPSSSTSCIRILPSFRVIKPRFITLATSNSASLSSESIGINGSSSLVKEKEEKEKGSVNNGVMNGLFGSRIEKKDIDSTNQSSEDLDVLWDDGYGVNSVKDYLDIAKDMVKLDGGPPRWFTPLECGKPLKNSPVLLFLPGMDGIGLGLILHHKALGKAFEVRCMHIPTSDRTPFEGLLKIVEDAVRLEHSLFPNRPIYLVGDSLGGCLALSVAARNPTIDLVLILSNPATSFGKSQLQPLLPILEALPNELHITVPYLLSFVMGEPVKMATVNIEKGLSPVKTVENLSENLTGLLPRLSGLADIIPKKALLWKIKLLNSAAAYTNSRLHAIKAEVLVLASGKDNMLPSGDEAQRLKMSLKNCRVRYFKDNGHTLLLEDGVNLLSVIKATHMYRHSRRYDYISDYLPPSMSEYRKFAVEGNALFRTAASAAMFSTLGDGKIVRGLEGVPTEGPILLVGYHMLMGLELPLLIEEFLRVKKVMVRGIAHPILFSTKSETAKQEFSNNDIVSLFGAVPVSASYMFKLLSTNSVVLLYPGGAREALHSKGEEYKCFWPEQPEFVRMAAQFGATIVPFGAVGEDDLAQYVLDYDDQMKIPFLGDFWREQNEQAIKLRADATGEVGNQNMFIPGLLPKIPGRLYYLFGTPIETKGKKKELKDRDNANVLYLQIKSEVENMMSYLVKQREEDPYRGIVERTLYKTFDTPLDQIPTFEP